jgi:hypothetical protein
VATLPEEVNKYLNENKMMAIAKIPPRVYDLLSKAMVKEYGKGDPGVFQDYAARVAMEDLGAAMRFFMKIGTPEFTGKKFDGVYSHYFSNGTWTTVESTSKSLVSKLVNHQVLGEGICWGSLGWTRAALQYAGAKNLRASHAECVFHGGAQCVFKYEWE